MKKVKHKPLQSDILSSYGTLKNSTSEANDNERDLEDKYINLETSKKILSLSVQQQNEIENEYEENDISNDKNKKQYIVNKNDMLNEDISFKSDESDNYNFTDDQVDDFSDNDDINLFDNFFQKNNKSFLDGSYNLADKILEKLNTFEKKDDEKKDYKLSQKVLIAYKKIGEILSTYRHGKLPKLFKILPTLKNWESILFVTRPENWSPQAVYEGTRLFVSCSSTDRLRKFIELVLFEKFRDSIADSPNHKLNYHIYRALKKSLFKPSVFFKGFLLTLVKSGCSKKEALIVSSILNKTSIPVLHSSVALSYLLEEEFKPTTILFIKVLIQKKYALPYQIIDELVFFFSRFKNLIPDMDSVEPQSITKKNTIKLPLIWHKTFLSFVQMYKHDITDDQRNLLLETIKKINHDLISNEIRRELLSGRPRIEKTLDV